MSGYESRKELSKGVHDPISARAVAFEQGGKRLVLISTDLIGFYDGTAKPLRQAILDACQLKPEELFLAAVHDHSAPTPTFDEAKGHSNNIAYTRILQANLVRVSREALDRMVRVKIEAGSGAAPVGANRRQLTADKDGNPRIELGRDASVLTDREVQVLKITDATSGELAALIFDHGTHSTSLGPRNFLISGDVHGLAEQFVEAYLGGRAVVPGFAGASGDIDPWFRVLPGFRTTNGWIPEPILLGTLLGEEVVHVMETMSKTGLGGTINAVWKTLELPGKPSGEIRTTTNQPPTMVNLTVARVGQIAFVGFGGEMFNEIGLAIKRGSPFAHTLVITHCNGSAGYLPVRRAYLEGGYEVQSSPFGSAAAEQVIKETLRMLNSL